MKISMTVNDELLEYEVHEQLYFDVEDVFPELGEQPGQLAWWYSLLTYKQHELDNFKAEFERAKAQRELDIRRGMDALVAKYGKVTEAIIAAEVAIDDELEEMLLKLNELKKQVGLLKAMTGGMESRSVLLATAASAQKAEVQARLRQLTKRAKGESEEAENEDY